MTASVKKQFTSYTNLGHYYMKLEDDGFSYSEVTNLGQHMIILTTVPAEDRHTSMGIIQAI